MFQPGAGASPTQPQGACPLGRHRRGIPHILQYLSRFSVDGNSQGASLTPLPETGVPVSPQTGTTRRGDRPYYPGSPDCQGVTVTLFGSSWTSRTIPDKCPISDSTCPVTLGGLNRSKQHSSRTRLTLKTKVKSLTRVDQRETLPWLGFDRGQPNRLLLPEKPCRIKVLDGVASTG